MLNIIIISFGKIFSKLVQVFNLGAGSTWPGHIALILNKNFIHDVLSKSDIKTILIAGTNGKTTTAKLIRTGLEKNNKTVIQNQAGANLLNGIASTLIQNANFMGKLKQNFAIFEIDENTLPLVLKELRPDYLVLLNLFRDQLDRYGEVNIIVEGWKKAIEKITEKTTIILNADDPQIAYLSVIPSDLKGAEESHTIISRKDPSTSLGMTKKVLFFGLQPSQFGNNKLQHAADSIYCPRCNKELIFDAIAFSHLGNWHCKECGLKRPKIKQEKFTVYPLPGLYNKYNVLAANLVLKQIGLTEKEIADAFEDFVPAFGRQEIIRYKNKNVQIFLSKNPTSFNQSYQTILELNGKNLLLVLNDRTPDGLDVSWIWDIDLPNLSEFKNIFVSGDRAYDMALRLKYELPAHNASQSDAGGGIMNYESRVKTFENLEEAIDEGIKSLEQNETLFILPTYSAMLEVRKIITGKKIL